MSLSLPQIARTLITGAATLAELAIEGRLSEDQLWTAAEGAMTFLRAIDEGDVASDAKRAARLAQCRVCPHRTGRAEAGYCGPAMVDHSAALDGPRTCGCLVDGKAAVNSETCLEGNWLA